MLRRNLSIPLFILLLTCLEGSLLFAETHCRATVDYQWSKEGSKEGEKENQVVQLKELESSGANEEEAKRALQTVLLRERKEALETCRRERESLARCIAGKFAAFSSTIDRMSFQSRKSLEEAIASDCAEGQGHCSLAEEAKIECREEGSGEEDSEAEKNEKKK